jgi:hypothetical protein
MLTHDAKALIDRLDTINNVDDATQLVVQKERGWVESIMHFAERNMLTPDGIEEAKQALAASREWADDLFGEDLVMPPVVVGSAG